MTYTSCSGCYQGANYRRSMPEYRHAEHSSSNYKGNGIELNFAPDSAYLLTGKEYRGQ